MAATTMLDPSAHTGQSWPKLTRCDRCGEEILRARHAHQGRPYTLDPVPVLPEGPCGTCRGRGTKGFQTPLTGKRSKRATIEPGDLYGQTRACPGEPCPVCKGTRRRGEPLTPDHVLVPADGIARPYDPNQPRHTWEAAHRRHHCTP